MPLMGNPSVANLLYGSTGAVETFVAFTTSATVLSTATASSSITITKLVAEQQADQLSIDESAPLILYLALGGLLLLCIIISHPRFLARLFASLPPNPLPSRTTSSNPFEDKSSIVVERKVGGGGLWDGWWLRRGARPVQIGRSSSYDGARSSPLPSPVNEQGPPRFQAADTVSRLHPPPHIVPLLTHLPSSSSLLFTPFTCLPNPFKSSVTVVQLYFIISYLLFIAFALVWHSDLNPTTKTSGYGADFARSGIIATAQIPIVVALGVRGNIIGLCVGKGYERLKVYHKIVGRTVFLATTVHVVGCSHKWVIAGKFWEYSQKQWAACGFLAYASLIFIVITSLPWIRKAWHGVFEICHFIGIVGLLVGLSFHVDAAVPFCIAALFVYLLSIVCSLSKTRLAHAELQALPGAATTLITIPALRSGWRAGQHVRIRIPALGFPLGLEAHPFTIASAPHGEGMVLMCKQAGNWTKRLLDLAQSSDMEAGNMHKQNTTVILEGPYGGVGNTMLPSFSSTVFISGGSGITHALGLAHDLVYRAPTGVVRARTIDLVWVVRSEDVAKPFMPTLLELVSDAKAWETECIQGRRNGEDRPQPTALRVKIHVTRCPASSPLRLLPKSENPFEGAMDLASEAEREKLAYLSRNPSSASTATYLSTKDNTPMSAISVTTLRPQFSRLLSDVAEQTIARHGRSMTHASGMCVTACGPQGMVDSVREAARTIEGYKQRAVGGVEFEEEHFGF